VVDGELNAQLFDGDIPHDARAADVEDIVVALDLVVVPQGGGKGLQLCVVGGCAVEQLCVLVFR